MAYQIIWTAEADNDFYSITHPAIQIIKLDKKNVLFFTIENNSMILLSIYPYKKDIAKSKYY